MKVISSSENIDQVLKEFSNYLNTGKIVIFPSDTCYGLAVDPTNEKAMIKAYKLKRRPAEKLSSCIFKDIEQAMEWADFGLNIALVRKNLPGAFTFVTKATEKYPGKDTVGVRIPNSNFVKLLAENYNKPFLATSANLGGFPPCYSLAELLNQFHGVSTEDLLIIDSGPLPKIEPSTVVMIADGNPRIIREGSGKLIL